MDISSRLKLKKPHVSDDIQDTIQWLYQNFDIIDVNFDETIPDIKTFLTSGQLYESGKRFWSANPSLEKFAGWVNIRTGIHALPWRSQVTYNAGDIITMGENDGHYYQCIVGGTSAVNEPLFSPTAEAITLDLNGASPWVANYNYQLNDIVVATNGDKSFYYKCIKSGASRSVEPTWTSISGTTINDGSVTWYAYKTVQWKERGVSCEFVPFGRINNNKFSVSIGDGVRSSYTINHRLGTQDVVVMVRETASPFSQVEANIKFQDVNNIVVTFDSAPSLNQYRVTIVG